MQKALPVKAGQLGLRQSDALFHHTAALPDLLAELGTKADLTQIGAVGVSAKPRPVEGSYMPCFLAGVNAAAAFALGKGIPLIHTTHQQGHIAAALFATGERELFEQENLVFHVSGGTTDLLLCQGAERITPLGTSQDLYAGQAVDRLGVKLGYPFPAGAYVSEQAAQCTEKVHPKVSVKGVNCSLSGLENQYTKLLAEGKDPAYVCKYCLICVAETLIRMRPAPRWKTIPPAGGVCRRRDEQRPHPHLRICLRLERTVQPCNLPAITPSACRSRPHGSREHGRPPM